MLHVAKIFRGSHTFFPVVTYRRINGFPEHLRARGFFMRCGSCAGGSEGRQKMKNSICII